MAKRLFFCRAFTLVEVVLALGLIAFSLVAIIGVFPTGMRANRLSITDTRAAQLATAITSAIDAQTKQFSNVDCYGVTLDLATLDKTAAKKSLHVSYPSPNQPTISANASGDTIYTVDLTFDNDPEIAPGRKLGPGKLNLIQMRMYGRSTTEGAIEFFHLARKTT